MAFIELRLFATLAAQLPDNALHYPIEAGTTIDQLIKLLGVAAPDARLVFINGVRSTLEDQLFGGERVGIFPPVGGG
jgi:molybdopterin synthase sulfur carrier subunit